MSLFVLRSAVTHNIYNLWGFECYKIILESCIDVDNPGALGSIYSKLYPDWKYV